MVLSSISLSKWLLTVFKMGRQKSLRPHLKLCPVDRVMRQCFVPETVSHHSVTVLTSTTWYYLVCPRIHCGLLGKGFSVLDPTTTVRRGSAGTYSACWQIPYVLDWTISSAASFATLRIFRIWPLNQASRSLTEGSGFRNVISRYVRCWAFFFVPLPGSMVTPAWLWMALRTAVMISRSFTRDTRISAESRRTLLPVSSRRRTSSPACCTSVNSGTVYPPCSIGTGCPQMRDLTSITDT